MQPMLKTVDIFIGLSLVMLLVSMVVTVVTQIVTNLLNSRGKHLMNGVADILEQLHPGITRKIADEIADAVLRNPLVADANGKLGSVVHREELTKLVLELGAGDGVKPLSEAAQQALQTALVQGGICQNGTPAEIQSQIREKLKNVQSLALQLELTHPDLTNSARARVAMIQQANSQFLAKINLWFDQTMDRASARFTAHTRFVTFFAAFAIALALQLDTAALVSRLSVDDTLRQSLVTMAQQQVAANPPAQPQATGQPTAANPPVLPQATGQPTAANAPAQQQAAAGQPTANTTGQPTTRNPSVALSPLDIQNIKDMEVNNVIGIPQSLSDWANRWSWDNCVMKILGILLSAFLLSLGAPFWYGALQNLLRLRSLLATKDDQQREQRQVTGTATSTSAVVTATDGVVLTDERGDLAALA